MNIFSVKISVLVKKILKSWFHGKFLRVIAFYSTFPYVCIYVLWGKIKLPHCAVWKLRNFTAILQNFRQINVLLKNFAINWFDGKELCGSEFLVFPYCVDVPCAQCWKTRNSPSPTKYRQIDEKLTNSILFFRTQNSVKFQEEQSRSTQCTVEIAAI